MKILFVGLGRAGKLFSTEHLFREKLYESSLDDVEVATADMADLGSPGGRRLESNLKEIVSRGVDIIVVMEKWQKELLTRFIEYASWNKIHLFGDICKRNKAEQVPSCDVDIAYRSDHEKINDGCGNLIEQLRTFIKERQLPAKLSSV